MSAQPDTPSAKLSDSLGPIGTAVITPTLGIVGWAVANPQNAWLAGMIAFGLGVFLFALWFVHRRDGSAAYNLLFYVSFGPMIVGLIVVAVASNGSASTTKMMKSRVGLLTTELAPNDASDLIGSNHVGVLVKQVEKDSLSDKAGLQPGDVIQKANNTVVITRVDLDAQLDRLPRSGALTLNVWRAGRSREITIQPP